MELISSIYDFKTFTLATGQTNYDVKTNVAELFDNITVARKLVIKTNQTITIRLNNVNYPAIEINVTNNESPFQLPKDFLDVTNVFITNSSGNLATISIMLA